jgi:hypothetical protein
VQCNTTEAAKDPNAPKKPLSAYFIFLAAKRAVVKTMHPDLKPKELYVLTVFSFVTFSFSRLFVLLFLCCKAQKTRRNMNHRYPHPHALSLSLSLSSLLLTIYRTAELGRVYRELSVEDKQEYTDEAASRKERRF